MSKLDDQSQTAHCARWGEQKHSSCGDLIAVDIQGRHNVFNSCFKRPFWPSCVINWPPGFLINCLLHGQAGLLWHNESKNSPFSKDNAFVIWPSNMLYGVRRMNLLYSIALALFVHTLPLTKSRFFKTRELNYLIKLIVNFSVVITNQWSLFLIFIYRILYLNLHISIVITLYKR